MFLLVKVIYFGDLWFRCVIYIILFVCYVEELLYFESGIYVVYNNEDGGVIEKLEKDGIVNFDF